LLESGLGSVSEILGGKFSLRSAPLVLANILAPVIIRLFDAGLAELAAPGGVMVLSGILDVQAADVIRAAEAHGLRLLETRQINDWVAISLAQPDGA
jgi:ribosomal protein L11 methyltransferase